MADSAIDNNRVHSSLAYNSSTGLSEPIQVATASGRLLIDISIVSESSPSTIAEIRDGNYVPGMICVDDNGTIVPLIADSRNGLLFVDIEIE